MYTDWETGSQASSHGSRIGAFNPRWYFQVRSPHPSYSSDALHVIQNKGGAGMAKTPKIKKNPKPLCLRGALRNLP